MKLLLRMIIIICVSFSFFTTTAKPNCRIEGKTVDENGEPVGGAFILLAPRNPTFVSDLLGTGIEADEKGLFTLEFDCAKTKRKKSLYVTSPVLRDVKNILLPPFESLVNNNSLFGGIPILLKTGNVTKVGDIKIQIYYTVVKLALVDKFGKPFFTTNEQWNKLWVKLRDEKGTLVVDEGMSVEDYRDHTEADASALKIALPEGMWNVELYPEGRDGKFVTRKSFAINKSDSTVKVVFVVEAK